MPNLNARGLLHSSRSARGKGAVAKACWPPLVRASVHRSGLEKLQRETDAIDFGKLGVECQPLFWRSPLLLNRGSSATMGEKVRDEGPPLHAGDACYGIGIN